MDGVGTALRPSQAIPLMATAAKAHGTGFVEAVRLETLLSNNSRSLASIASALKCWSAFADQVLGAQGRHLPPTSEGLIAFSRLFRNAGTFANYVSAIRSACVIANIPTASTYARGIRRATAAISKRQLPQPAK